MQAFEDNTGRKWTVEVNVGAIKRVRALTETDLLEVLDGGLIDKLIRDPVLLCDVIFAVCKPAADSAGISDEDFGRAMAGDAIEHATKALLEELVDFSPSPASRANLKRVIEMTWNVMDRANKVVAAKLDSGEMEKAVDRLFESAGNASFDVPALSASAPIDSRSVN